MRDNRLQIDYFTDLLCVWAYVAQIRIDELRQSFPGQLTINQRFVSIFGSVAERIGGSWTDRGGLAGYAEHVRHVADGFGHIEINPRVWSGDVPAGSLSAHAFVRAAALSLAQSGVAATPDETTRPPLEELIWRTRLAFFRDSRNIARLDVQMELASELDLPGSAIRKHLDDGSALAALAEDHASAQRHGVTGSPTYLLNDGRQKLYGNVGYRIIEANVEELLRDDTERASWC